MYLSPVDPRFVMTFLLGYRHFASPMELLSLLLRRYPYHYLHFAASIHVIYLSLSLFVVMVLIGKRDLCGWAIHK